MVSHLIMHFGWVTWLEWAVTVLPLVGGLVLGGWFAGRSPRRSRHK